MSKTAAATTRRAKIFDLLRQGSGQLAAVHYVPEKPVKKRYLDDETAAGLLRLCHASLRGPEGVASEVPDMYRLVRPVAKPVEMEPLQTRNAVGLT